MKLHMQVHIEEKPFKCRSCDKSCFSKTALLIHAQIHKGVKAFECPLGEKPLSSSDFRVMMENSRKTFVETLKRIHGFGKRRKKLRQYKGHTLKILHKRKLSSQKDFHEATEPLHDVKYSYNERPYGCGLCLETFRTKVDTVQHYCLYH